LLNNIKKADVGKPDNPEAILVEDPKGEELEYHIIPVNKAGEDEPSNTEMVVL